LFFTTAKTPGLVVFIEKLDGIFTLTDNLADKIVSAARVKKGWVTAFSGKDGGKVVHLSSQEEKNFLSPPSLYQSARFPFRSPSKGSKASQFTQWG